jgi:hypothetical protein
MRASSAGSNGRAVRVTVTPPPVVSVVVSTVGPFLPGLARSPAGDTKKATAVTGRSRHSCGTAYGRRHH